VYELPEVGRVTPKHAGVINDYYSAFVFV